MPNQKKFCMLGESKVSYVCYIWYYVSNLDRALTFYRDVLGLKLVGQWSNGATFDANNLMIGLHIQEGEIQKGNEPLVTFHIDSNIEKFYDMLKKHGVKLLGQIVEEPIGKVVSLEDPDGHVLSLHEPRR